MINGIFFNYLSFVIRLLSPFLTIPIINRCTTEDFFNEYMLFLAISSLSATAFEYGYNQIAIPLLSKSLIDNNDFDVERYLFKYESGRVIIWIFIFLLALAFIPLNINISLAVITGGLLGCLPVYYFQSSNNFKMITVIEMIANVIFMIFVYIISIKYENSEIYIYIYLGYRLVSFVLYYCFFYSKIRIRISILSGLSVLKQNFSLSMSRLILTSNTSMTVPMIGFILGKSSLGTYAVTEKLIFAAISLIYPLSQVITVFSSQNKNTKLIRIMVMVSVLLFTCTAIIVSIFSDYLMKLYLGGNSDELGVILKVYVFLVPLRALSNLIVSIYYYPKGKHNLYSRISFFYGLSSLVMSPFIIYSFGVYFLPYYFILIEIFMIFILFYFKFKSDEDYGH
jgi:O-antigen/teichoic acid export membrane protein